jgi:hypothetical protein
MSRVAVRLPPFWAERPAAWFAQAEVHFTLAGISNERTKFYHVISKLDQQHAAQVEDIITSPPQKNPYTKLRTELVKRLSPSKEQGTPQFHTLEEMGDRKPCQFLRYFRRLVPEASDDILRSNCSSRLPRNVQAKAKGELDTATHCADHITEAAPMPIFANYIPHTETSTLLQSIDDVSLQMAELGAQRNRSCSGHRCSRSRNPTYSTGDRRFSPLNSTATRLCWYHLHFGARAQKCTHPCAYHQQRKPEQQTATAASVYTTTTRRFFVTDRRSKQQFLINTGSDLCMFPRKLIPQHKERVNSDIRAANGTTVATYGWLSLSLNLGLSQDFQWRFVVADVLHPLIGADFLSHFGLLVDCRNRRLLEGTTSLSVPSPSARLAQPWQYTGRQPTQWKQRNSRSRSSST